MFYFVNKSFYTYADEETDSSSLSDKYSTPLPTGDCNSISNDLCGWSISLP